MAVGFFRQEFKETSSYAGGTYSWADVRIRQTIIRAFADYLVTTGFWTIENENIPTANYTSASTKYEIWLKFKTNAHLVRISTIGGLGTTERTITFAALKVGSTTTAINTFTMIVQSSGENVTPYARLLITGVYGDTWMSSTVIGWDPASSDINGNVPNVIGGCVFENLFDTDVTTDILCCGYATSILGHQQLLYQFLTGEDIAYSAVPVALPTTEPGKSLIGQTQGKSGTDWRVKELYNFTNAEAISVGSVVIIEGHYYWHGYSKYLWHLGAVPT